MRILLRVAEPFCTQYIFKPLTDKWIYAPCYEEDGVSVLRSEGELYLPSKDRFHILFVISAPSVALYPAAKVSFSASA